MNLKIRLRARMLPSRMELFDRCAGVVFAQLYESFPERITINLDGAPKSLFDDTDDNDEIWQKLNVFETTVLWLQQAGYIWVTEIAGATATGVVLTLKALEVLKVTPKRLTNKLSLGSFIVDSVKSGAKERVQDGVRIALDEGVKAFWRWG